MPSKDHVSRQSVSQIERFWAKETSEYIVHRLEERNAIGYKLDFDKLFVETEVPDWVSARLVSEDTNRFHLRDEG